MKRTVNGTVEYYGYCIDLLEDIKNILGFEYTIYETPDGVYGNMDENMNWNGMIKELIDKVSISLLQNCSETVPKLPQNCSGIAL